MPIRCPRRAPGPACFRDPVVLDDQIAGRGRDIEAVARLGAAIVQHLVVAERVTVTAVGERLVAEIDAALSVPRNGVVDKLVIRILVADGDAVEAIAFAQWSPGATSASAGHGRG